MRNESGEVLNLEYSSKIESLRKEYADINDIVEILQTESVNKDKYWNYGELKKWENNSSHSILAILRLFRFQKLNYQDIELIGKILIASGRDLPYEEYTLFVFSHLFRIDYQSKHKAWSRSQIKQGFFECGINYRESGNCFIIRNVENEKHKVINWDLSEDKQNSNGQSSLYKNLDDDEQRYTEVDGPKPGEEGYINPDPVGYKKINKENYFKVIRTPISNRTIVIGGADGNRNVRELKNNKDEGMVECLRCINYPDIRQNINVFNCFSKIAKITQEPLTTFRNEGDEREINDIILGEIDKAREYVKHIKSREVASFHFVDTGLQNWLKSIYEQFQKGKVFKNLDDFCSEMVVIALQLLSNVTALISDIYQLAAIDTFTQENLQNLESFYKKESQEEEKLALQETGDTQSASLNATKDNEECSFEKLDNYGLKNTFYNLIREFLFKCVEYRKEEIMTSFDELKLKVGQGNLETKQTKQHHALAADENFVYITGGSFKESERRFEILVLKYNILVDGPWLVKYRKHHWSFILNDYLYVFGGEVSDGYQPTFSFERIKLPSILSIKREYPESANPTREEVLKNLQKLSLLFKESGWTYYTVEVPEYETKIFKVFYPCITLEEQIFCFGQINDSESEVIEKNFRIELSINNQYTTLPSYTVKHVLSDNSSRDATDEILFKMKESSFDIPIEEIKEDLGSTQVNLIKNKSIKATLYQTFKERVHYPVAYNGQLWLPHSDNNTNDYGKWNLSSHYFEDLRLILNEGIRGSN